MPTPDPETMPVPNQPKQVNNIDFNSLVNESEAMQALKAELLSATKLSLTGISNLVVNHENPSLVDAFLRSCFKMEELFHNTQNIDAVELQQGQPQKGYSVQYLEQLIFGHFKTKEDKDGMPELDVDPRTGKRERKADGFLSRKEILQKDLKDKTLIIRNVDYALDFCRPENDPGEVDPRASWIFDNFRHPQAKLGCRILLISNKKIVLPFNIRTVEFPKVTDSEANHLINSVLDLYTHGKYELNLTNNQREQLVRKISGLTYNDAGDALFYATSKSEFPKKSKKINTVLLLKHLRERINKNFLESGTGLTQLSPRPWEDYICPESSNFTFDVYKMLRDFKEIERLKTLSDKLISKSLDEGEVAEHIDAVQMRVPHVIVLYGRGGTGKSAFPVHLAGLLGFDIWDFNINATHSKWVGEGSKQMRETLKQISNASHLIVRIDEYDRAMGAAGQTGQGMHEAHKQVESEFMNWLQNSQDENLFIKNNIILVLTTNHKENITGPLLRSGRSDLVIDIDNFDAKSMKETFVTSARRMNNRGIKVLGYDNKEEFQKAINALDLDQLSELATLKGFTVRDIESMLMEMAAHAYYHKITSGAEGLAWTNENFIDVLEHSEGSVKDDATGELILGDRWVLTQKKNEVEEVAETENSGFEKKF